MNTMLNPVLNPVLDAGPDELTASMAAVDAAAARAVLADRLQLAGVDLEHPVVVAVLAAVVSAGWRPRPATAPAPGPSDIDTNDDDTAALFDDTVVDEALVGDSPDAAAVGPRGWPR